MKKRNVGDIVRKKANAGFIGEPLVIKLVDIDPDYLPYDNYCFVCDDGDCREWTNCEIIMDGKPTGEYCYHVSECEMEDL